MQTEGRNAALLLETLIIGAVLWWIATTLHNFAPGQLTVAHLLPTVPAKLPDMMMCDVLRAYARAKTDEGAGVKPARICAVLLFINPHLIFADKARVTR